METRLVRADKLLPSGQENHTFALWSIYCYQADKKTTPLPYGRFPQLLVLLAAVLALCLPYLKDAV
jgi:hypothetical protein